MAYNWSEEHFCGQSFSIKDINFFCFSLCFETFVFVLGPFALLAISSAYYIGFLRPPDVNLRTPSSFKLRKMCTVVTLFFTLGALLNDLILFKQKVLPVMLVAYCVRIVTLLIHFIFLWRLSLIHFNYKRGPALVTISWFLTFPYYGVRLERMIVEVIDNSKTDVEINRAINMFCIAGMVGCQLAYTFGIVQGNSRYMTASILSLNSRSTENLSTSINVNDRYYNVADADVPLEETEELCPVESAWCLSKLLFFWVQPLMRKGSNRLLNQEDSVYQLPSDLQTKHLCINFNEKLHDIVIKTGLSNENSISSNNQKPKRNLLRTLHAMFGKKYYLLGFLKFGADALSFAGPIFLNLLVTFVEKDRPISEGCIYAAALFASTLIGSLLMTHFDYQVNKLAIAMKSSLIGAVYSKSMKSKPVPLGTYSTGEITNFMGTDVNRVVNFCPSFHQFWSLPFQVIVTLVLLYYQVGIVFLAGLGLTLLMILFNRYLAIKIGEYNKGLMEHKDSRIKLMTEILLGIRVVKFNVWEDYLTNEINNIRTKELKSLRGIKYFDALCVYLWATTPILISLLVFSIYAATGHNLTAAKVFTVVALINMLISPLNAFPWVLNGLMEAWVSLDRLEKFANLPDFDMEKYYDTYVTTTRRHHVLKIDDGTFSWNPPKSEQEEKVNQNPVKNNYERLVSQDHGDEVVDDGCKDKDLLLQRISLLVHPGQFVGVIGTVGSGKSSLLSAICAEMEKLKGSISLCDAQEGVALVTQEPWIQHASIKDNILWGEPYNKELYEAAVECCALNDDFNILPHGDMTEVGENGVTLSGGQKARISLARAVYQNKSFYLMDDPLSAVDQHVAAHLYHQCISGILRDRTRILCTHHIKYLRHADLIVEMEHGKIKALGLPNEILALEGMVDEEFTAPMQSNTQRNEDNRDEKATSLMSAEEKAVGTVALKVYKAYWLAIGGCIAFSILLFVVLMQGSKVASDWWLSFWVNGTSSTNTSHLTSCHGGFCINNSNEHAVIGTPLVLTDVSYTVLLNGGTYSDTSSIDNKPWSWYLMIYGIIAACNSVFTFIRAFTFAYGGICAARVLHKNLLDSIMQAPISFFDVTPIGRIINRFASDMYTIDDSLPFMLNIFLAQFAGLIATIAVTCYGLPYFAILLIPLSVFYYYTQRYYRYTSRELKRLSSISLSPIYAHFTESLMGISTIRAYKKTDMFRDRNMELVDINQRCNFSTLAAQQWLAIRLQMMGVVMVTGVAFTAVLEKLYGSQSRVTAGMVGLALSYALSVTSRLSGVITSFTETEKQMVAVERQSYYIGNVPQERLTPLHEQQLREAWPSGGAIEFRHVSLRYRPSLPMAIDDVVFKIEPGEKVGIVGRTGSGKSSLFLTLFGMVPIGGGTILIDDVGIGRIPLRTLRSKMAIIPQDPFLFNGSIRSNLDPTQQAGHSSGSDTILWWALESCGLRKVVENMGGLDTEAGERGKRFSVGQRQLICLARALLRDVQIVCLDEATANVDRHSDSLLQETIKRQFSRRTVLTIAHRIETILDSDRVLVMSDGRVAEFDRPQNLLENSDTLFARLVQQSNSAGIC